MNRDILTFDKVISRIDLNQNILDDLKENLYLFTKRCFDIFVSLIGVIFLVPVLFILKLAFMLSGDFKPMLFKQRRIGKFGKDIYIYKVRSMVPNAEEELKKLLKVKKYKKEWDKNQKLENDPRITKIGKFIRKTSIDEIPQFINVLKGDMSLIGPRPLVVNELDNHGGSHRIYESVKPGITGWWACNGRSAIDYKERLNLEYYYINNKSISLDFKCIYKTIAAVINKNGAK